MNRQHDPSHRAKTLVDVAREAKVSVSTAARVLRNASYPVTAELRKRVLAAAAKLGYVPNLLARSLRGTETTYIGLIVGNMREPYFGEIAEAVTNEARLLPGLAIVSNMQRDPRLEIELCQQLWEHRVKGLILAGGSYDQETCKDELEELVSRMSRAGVIVTSLATRLPNTPTFTVDNESVGLCLSLSILQQGHREIGIIFGSPKSETTQARLNSLRSSLAAANPSTYEIYADFGGQGGGDAAETLITQHPQITALICGGDTLAVGAMQRLQLMGHRIPDDFSVIGLGNTSYSRLTAPQLSTVEVNVTQSARAAVRYIEARLAGVPHKSHKETKIGPATFIERDTIAPPRKPAKKPKARAKRSPAEK